MIDEERLAWADFWIIDHGRNRQRVDIDPLAILPVFAALRDFAQVNFRVEVGSEGLAVVAVIAVDDVDFADLVEQLFLGVGAVDVRLAGIEAAAQDRHDALFGELVVIGPLPLVSELGFVARLVVGGIHVMHAGFQAGVHDRQVLIWQGHVDYEVRLSLVDQRHGFSDVVGIHLMNFDRRLAAFGNFFAAFQPPRRQMDGFEDVAVHVALLRNHGAGCSRADDQYVIQSGVLLLSGRACWRAPG